MLFEIFVALKLAQKSSRNDQTATERDNQQLIRQDWLKFIIVSLCVCAYVRMYFARMIFG